MKILQYHLSSAHSNTSPILALERCGLLDGTNWGYCLKP